MREELELNLMFPVPLLLLEEAVEGMVVV